MYTVHIQNFITLAVTVGIYSILEDRLVPHGFEHKLAKASSFIPAQ